MKETSFIKQNKQKWYKFEKMYQQNRKDPDELSKLFVELTDDLSYSRTHYPKRSVRVYLNGLAQKVYNQMYRGKRDSMRGFLTFWTTSLPLEMYRARFALLAAFITFAIGVVIGVVSSFEDPDFLGVITGDGYIAQTKANIMDGKPMDIYADQDESSMFFMIAQNNLRVAFTSFALGIIIGLGTAFFMIFNGIMVGAFQAFFYHQSITYTGVFLSSALTIWLHGTFEILAIIISGAAGMTLGASILFPGTKTRMQSLLQGAKRGMKIMIGVSPFIVVAAFIESFVTRYGTQMHWGWNVAIILVQLLLVVWYFVIYPFQVARKHQFSGRLEEDPIPIQEKAITWYKIRNFGDVFNDTFVFYRKGFSYFGRVLFWLILLNIVYAYFAFTSSFYIDFRLEWIDKIGIIFGFNQFFQPILYCCNALLLAANVTAVYHSLKVIKDKEHEQEGFRYWPSFFRFAARHYWRALPITLVLLIAWAFLPWFFLILAVFLTPFIFNLAFPGIIEGKKFFQGLGRGFTVSGQGYMLGVGIFCVFLLPAALALLFPELLLDLFKTEVLDWFIVTTVDRYDIVHNIVDGSYYLIMIHLIIPLFLLAFSFLYFSIVEKEEAYGLFQRLEKFGTRSNVYETRND